MKRTVLFEAHQKLGGRLIEFGGWEMPVQYASITREHQAVRSAAGIFDISHMGEVFVEGPKAQAFLNVTLTNDLRTLAVGQGQYTLMCNDAGGTIDDLYAYRLADAEYLMIVNASRIASDFAWLQQRWAVFDGRDQVRLHDASENTGAVALQGPRAQAFIDEAFGGASIAGTAAGRPSDLARNRVASFRFGNAEAWVSRTGYTGEDGFEVVAANQVILSVWDRLLEAGRPHGLLPAGLGARDTLRTEMCYPLYGQELDETTSPIEAGLGYFVALAKGEFVGRSVLAAQRAGTALEETCCIQDAGKVRAPPAALSGLERRPERDRDRPGNKRNAEPVPQRWHRNGLRKTGICQNWQLARDRDSWQTSPCRRRAQAHLPTTTLTPKTVLTQLPYG